MAASGAAVSVLAPNGRRQTVKVTAGTPLLQVSPPAVYKGAAMTCQQPIAPPPPPGMSVMYSPDAGHVTRASPCWYGRLWYYNSQQALLPGRAGTCSSCASSVYHISCVMVTFHTLIFSRSLCSYSSDYHRKRRDSLVSSCSLQ